MQLRPTAVCDGTAAPFPTTVTPQLSVTRLEPKPIKQDSSGKVVAKCDFCPDLEVPACVANCPNEALVLEEAEE